ncbi:MAG: O-antigen ligase family protein [Alphaproteobacteria bacterium]|nr:O-antigen ligase family protein [Alphaproteobacteria bacterium]
MNGSWAPPRDGSSPYANILFGMTVVYFFLSIALVRFMVGGLPVRSLFGVLIFCAVYAIRPALLLRALADNWRLLLLIAYAAFLGLMVSLFNDATMGDTLRQLLEIHFQAALCLLTGYGLLHLMGARRLVYAFLIIACLSGVLAIMQSVHFDPAWVVREKLQLFQEYDAEALFLSKRMRAMGFSFSPVHLGTQICLGFAAVFLLYSAYNNNRELPVAMKIGLWLFIMLFIALVSGNRSPILGFAVFAGVYAFYVRPAYATLAALFLLPFFGLAYISFVENIDFFADTEVRALRVGDKSSEGREALRAFGGLLFMDRPFGYGLLFNSLLHVEPFWPELQHYENAETVWGNAVHNYYLLIALKYGVLFIPAVVYSIYRIIRNFGIILGFIPYAIHIYFHNDGPLQSDFMIWFFLPLIGYIDTMKNFNWAAVYAPQAEEIRPEGESERN